MNHASICLENVNKWLKRLFQLFCKNYIYLIIILFHLALLVSFQVTLNVIFSLIFFFMCDRISQGMYCPSTIIISSLKIKNNLSCILQLTENFRWLYDNLNDDVSKEMRDGEMNCFNIQYEENEERWHLLCLMFCIICYSFSKLKI